MNGQNGKNGDKQGKMKRSNEGQSKYLMKCSKNNNKLNKDYKKFVMKLVSRNGENIDRILEKMEQNEIDILNNNITNETILRHEEILTKLLEKEESQREKGPRRKKESIEWNFDFKNNSTEYLDYINKKKEQNELLRTVPIQLIHTLKKK